MSQQPAYNPEQVLEGKIFAVLAYLSILCIIPLLFKKDNPFVLAHGKQGLVLFVGHVAAFILITVLPWLLKPSLVIFGILALWGIIESLKGNDVRLPFAADIADKITL